MIHQLQKWHFSSLTFREQALMIGGYCLVVLVLFNLVYQPKRQEAERLKWRLAAMETEVQTLSTTLMEYEKNIKMGSSRKGGLPTVRSGGVGEGENGIPSIIRGIGRMAAEERVELISMRPSVQDEADGFLTLRIEIDTRSRFKHFLHYLERLEKSPDPIAVSDIRMETSLETSPVLSSRLIAEVRLWRGM